MNRARTSLLTALLAVTDEGLAFRRGTQLRLTSEDALREGTGLLAWGESEDG
jgi:hypothetical protein